jgi:hypothetical protein
MRIEVSKPVHPAVRLRSVGSAIKRQRHGHGVPTQIGRCDSSPERIGDAGGLNAPLAAGLVARRSGGSMVANDLIVIVIDPGSYQEPLLAG